MKYIIYFFLIVVFASLAGAPQVFAYTFDTDFSLSPVYISGFSSGGSFYGHQVFDSGDTSVCPVGGVTYALSRDPVFGELSTGVFGETDVAVDSATLLIQNPSPPSIPNYASIYSTYGDGDYLYTATSMTGCTGYPSAYVSQGSGYNYFRISGGVVSTLTPASTATRIISVDPYDKEIIATSTTFTTFSVTGYVGDYDEATLKVHVQNSAQAFTQCADVICSFYSGSAFSMDFETDLSDNASFVADYDLGTEPLVLGNYYVTSEIKQGNYCIFGLCLYDTTLVATSTMFTVATTTRADDLVTSNQDYLDDLFTADETFKNCGIADFNLFLCGSDLITWSFVPTPDAVSYMTTQLHDNVLTHFPVGYLTDFAVIVATTSTSTLTVLDATSTLFGNAHVRLDLNGILDQFLYATTGQYVNSSATSTATLFDITYPYWQFVNYLALLFYILSRLVGFHLFGGVSSKVIDKKQ